MSLILLNPRDGIMCNLNSLSTLDDFDEQLRTGVVPTSPEKLSATFGEMHCLYRVLVSEELLCDAFSERSPAEKETFQKYRQALFTPALTHVIPLASSDHSYSVGKQGTVLTELRYDQSHADSQHVCFCEVASWPSSDNPKGWPVERTKVHPRKRGRVPLNVEN